MCACVHVCVCVCVSTESLSVQRVEKAVKHLVCLCLHVCMDVWLVYVCACVGVWVYMCTGGMRGEGSQRRGVPASVFMYVRMCAHVHVHVCVCVD